MTDMLSLLMNAQVADADGDCVGEVTGVIIEGNRMMLSTNINIDLEFDYEEDDPDGGEEIDGDEDDEDEGELDPRKETGNVEPLRMVVG